MLIDARTLPANETIETEVCIVGSGPAGITLAREFLSQDFRVAVLESGKFEFDAETQSLCEGEVVGDDFPALDVIRRRQCGGTANAWNLPTDIHQIGAKLLPLDPVDFEQRDWMPHSGWPFDRTALDPFYERAQAICQIGPYNYGTEGWANAKVAPLPFKGDRVTTSIVQLGDSVIFTQGYRDEVVQSKNITLYLNANVVEVETNDSATVATGVRVACLSGKEFRVSAKIIILATGGVENVRLLLLSDRVQSNGLGNQHDLVGRYYMDHPLVRTGMFIPNDRNIFNQSDLYDWFRVNDILIKGKIGLTDAALRSEKILNMGSFIAPWYPIDQAEAMSSLKRLLKFYKGTDGSHNFLKDILQVVTGVDKIIGSLFKKLEKEPEPVNDGWSSLPNKDKVFGCFQVFSPTEQAPDPENRLTLSKQRDRLGCPQIKLTWHWREIDIESVKRQQQILAEEIARSGLGRLEIAREAGDMPALPGPGAHHPMGGTRMHIDPKQGVVDENCKVHGVSNLFIAGSSVFPTGGFANPTLTIVALSVRLADEVKQVMAMSKITVG